MVVEVALIGLCAVFAGGLWAIWTRMGQLGARLDGRIDRLDGRIDGLADRIDGLEERMNQRIDDLSERINDLSQRVARIEGVLAASLPAPEPSPH